MNILQMKDINSIAADGILFDGRYKLLKPLSSDGGTADVWLALDTNTIDEVYDDSDDRITLVEESGIKVAIKIYRPKNALDLGEQRFREEFKIVFNCHHTNLVQPINFSIFDGIPYLVLPYCRKGSSESLIGKFRDKDELWRCISDVSAGLAYLHAFSPTIVHHDIKPANILIDDSDNFAITDFGISSHGGINREGYDESHSGTMAYMAPERFKEDYQSIPESDIWSFGATLYELVTGKVPYGEDGGASQLASGSAALSPISQAIPSDVKNLIYDCLSLDISTRPSAEYIYKCAARHEYPIKNKLKSYIIAGLIAVIAIITSVLLLLPDKSNQTSAISAIVSNEARYSQAMALVGSDSYEDLTKGLDILDSLGNVGYVPALYQQAFTYGWYSDSASVARKRILGIEFYPKGTDDEWLPKSQMINSKAIGLLTRIEELNDSAYPEINANALYRLAAYYSNDRVLKQDDSRAKTLLKNARIWALKGNDTIVIRRINRGLINFDENAN